MTPRLAFLALLCAPSLLACLANLTPAGSAVKLSRQEPPPGACAELGVLSGGGTGGRYTSREDKEQSAENELRNKTAEAGGNLVVVEENRGDREYVTMDGRAFRCPGGPPPDGPPPDGAGDPGSTPPPPPPPPPPPRAAPSPPPSDSAGLMILPVEQRLARLKYLLDRGLITKEEYDRRRAVIVNAL